MCFLRLYRQNTVKERIANDTPIILDRIIWLEPLFVCELLPVSGVFAVVSAASAVFASFWPSIVSSSCALSSVCESSTTFIVIV